MAGPGKIDRGTGDFVINTPDVARPQENFLFNDCYFTCVHQTGNGFSKYTDPRGYATDIIAGTPEPAYNTNTRLVYLRDDETGACWNVGHYPMCRRYDSYECRHSPGVTTVSNRTNGILAVWRMFVPANDDPVELWTLTLRNMGRRDRRISVFAMTELSLESSAPLYGHQSYLSSCLLEESHGVAARKVAMGMPNPYFGAVFLSHHKPSSVDGDMNAFMGQFRTLANPLALERGRCSGSIASRDRVAGVLHHRMKLESRQTWRNDYLAGAADVTRLKRDAAGYHDKYLSDTGLLVDETLADTQARHEELLSNVSVKLSDYKLNTLVNRWIPLLIKWGATSGRWGILGFRDILQQSQGALMLGMGPKVTSRLEQALSHQHTSGYAVRSFPAVHEDSAMKYADSCVWLISSVTEYLKEYGCMEFLDQRAPLLDGPASTVRSHIIRAMEALWKNRGAHGLCLMHEGDWNDSLTHVGREGRGESVWLSQAFCWSCLQMAELSAHLGDSGAAQTYTRYYDAVAHALNQHCWDGEWYIRAFDDGGGTVGSKANRQGRIFLNTQSWALMSVTATPERVKPMLKSIRRYLRTPYGYMLLSPAYTEMDENIGRLSCLEPGCSENGSVYTHGNAFLAVGLFQHGMADEGYDVVTRIMPFNPKNPSKSVIPYQLSNGYGGPAHRSDPGKAQFGWSTGSGAWLHQAVVEYMLGLRRTYDGLVLRPCLPSCLKRPSVRRRYRDTLYNVSYTRRKAKGNTIEHLRVDGKEWDPEEALPVRPGDEVEVKVVLT
ncbi:GH36-type glycosyl hydrolase domain-containing protein [Verrucomicrobiota bacterium]